METTVTEQPALILGQILPLRRGDTKGGTDTGAGGDTGATQEPVPGAGGDTAGGGTAPLPVSASGTEVVPLTPVERTRLAVAHWAEIAANGAGQLWLNPGRLGHTLWTGKPGSMAEHREYVKSRAWVPPELDGKPAAFIAGAGVGYHLLIAKPLKAAALTVSAAADRPLRLTGLVVGLIILTVFVLPHIPAHLKEGIVMGGLNYQALALAVVFGTPAVVMLLHRKAPRLVAILGALAALCLVAGVPSFLALIGHPLAPGPILLGIIVAALASAMFFYFDLIRGAPQG